DPAALQAAYDAIYNPRSAAYHHFLDARQIGDRFGQPAYVYDGAVQWLRAGGLDVFQTTALRDFIAATGTVAQLDRRFAVEIRAYHGPRGDFLANAQAPTVPANLGITTVVGLNTLQQFQRPT